MSRSGSSHSGLNHWRIQRWSALPLAPLGLWFIFQMLFLEDSGFVAVREWVSAPHNATALGLLLFFLMIHAMLGLQTVIEDYVRGVWRAVLIGASRVLGVLLASAAILAIVTF
jgi:succinate dehydrogenase / fumarate reductase membrane anchor subunit